MSKDVTVREIVAAMDFGGRFDILGSGSGEIEIQGHRQSWRDLAGFQELFRKLKRTAAEQRVIEAAVVKVSEMCSTFAPYNRELAEAVAALQKLRGGDE